jgi:hypothetical protein
VATGDAGVPERYRRAVSDEAELLGQRDELLRENTALRLRLDRLNADLAALRRVFGDAACDCVIWKARRQRELGLGVTTRV